MFFPERRLVLLTVDPDGDTLHMRRFIGKNNDLSFSVSITQASMFKDGYRSAVVHDVIDILKLQPPETKA